MHKKSKRRLKGAVAIIIYILIFAGLLVGYGMRYGGDALLENVWTWVTMFFLVIPVVTFFVAKLFGKKLF